MFFFKYRNEKKSELASHWGLGRPIGDPFRLLGQLGRDGSAAPVPSGSGESVSTVPLAGLSRGQRWSGGAGLEHSSSIFSVFFPPEAAIFFFLEEKETGRWLFDAVC